MQLARRLAQSGTLPLSTFPKYQRPTERKTAGASFTSCRAESRLEALFRQSTSLRLRFTSRLILPVVSSEIIYARNIPTGSRSEVPKPSRFGITDSEDLYIPTPDGETLNAFFMRPANKAVARNITILMFHGNAGNIGHRLPIARILEESIGCNVLMVEYRGYGLSTGTPDEEGLMIDGQTGLDYIRQRPDVKGTKIVIYGQSLGGALAIALCAKNHDTGDIAGLILENTFTSMKKLIPSAFPPAKYIARLCHQNWTSELTLPKIINIPILFLSGRKDEIVPPEHMSALWEVCKAEKKTWKEFPNGHHNDTVAEPFYFDEIFAFLMNEVLKGST